MASFWRKQDPVMDPDDESRILKGGMLAHQRQWWDLPNFIKALVAGYGSGKTLIGSKRSISLALVNAPIPHLCVSPSYKIAKRTFVPAIKELLNGKQTLDPSLSWKYNKSDHEFTIYHRGREGKILVLSGDDPDSLKGSNAASASIDEPFIQDKAVFDQILARIRDPKAKIREVSLTGTPEELNWGYDICEGEENHKYDIGIVHAHTRDNYILSEHYADTLESAYSNEASQAYLGGQFVNLSTGRVYYAFDPTKNIVELEDPGHELHVGMDFNVNPMAAVVFWMHGNHIHIVGEIELDNADTEYMCSFIREQYVWQDGPQKGECRVRTVFPDASGKARATNAPGGRSDFHLIEEAGFHINAPRANPPIRDRENAVNGKFKSKEGKVTLTISPKCKRLKKYLLNYTHENKRKNKDMSHLLDALGYPVHSLFPIYKPVVEQVRFSGH